MKVKSESEVTQSCPTLGDSMDCSLPGSSIHGIFRARVLEWVAVAFSGTSMKQKGINVFSVARVEWNHQLVEAETPISCDEEMLVACGADGV